MSTAAACVIIALLLKRRKRRRRKGRSCWVRQRIGRREKSGAYHSLLPEIQVEDNVYRANNFIVSALRHVGRPEMYTVCVFLDQG